MIVFIISEMHRKAQILPTRVFIAPVWSENFIWSFIKTFWFTV